MKKNLENRISEAARSVEPSQNFSEGLWRKIQNSPQPIPAHRRAPRWRWIPATAIVTGLVITLLIISPQQVWASLRGLFDFLPGIGLVQDDQSTLYLTKPVSVTENGVTLTIDQVVSDANQTVVSYHIDGLPGDSSDNTSACFYDDNRLQLPDGKILLPTGGGAEGDGASGKARIEFAKLPEGITQATLLAGMNTDEPACTAPAQWKVDFTMSTTKPADVNLLPVVESTAVSTAESESSNDIQLSIDKSVAVVDGYVVYGHINYTDKYWQSAGIDFDTLTAQDAKGKNVPVNYTDDTLQGNEFVIKVFSKDFKAPLKLHIKNLWIGAIYDSPNFGIPVFTFDAGSDPQVGQSWKIDKEVDVDGIKLNIQNIEVVQEPAGQSHDATPEKGYTITVGKSSAVNFNASYFCEGEGNGSPNHGEGRSNAFTYYYTGDLPYGQVTCSIADANFMIPGNWEIEWQPPTSAN